MHSYDLFQKKGGVIPRSSRSYFPTPKPQCTPSKLKFFTMHKQMKQETVSITVQKSIYTAMPKAAATSTFADEATDSEHYGTKRHLYPCPKLWQHPHADKKKKDSDNRQ